MTTRILVVEDEQDIAGLIKHTLEKTGQMQVDVVGAGDAALRTLSQSEPDLIILDLNLPVLSGVEVCRIVRTRDDTAHIPIIMLTARSAESDRVTRRSPASAISMIQGSCVYPHKVRSPVHLSCVPITNQQAR